MSNECERNVVEFPKGGTGPAGGTRDITGLIGGATGYAVGGPTGATGHAIDTASDFTEAVNLSNQNQQATPDQPVDAEAVTQEETTRKKALQAWLENTADRVIDAVREDIGLHFQEGEMEDEQSSTVDLTEDYDPIINAQTGSRLSDEIRQAAERLRIAEKGLRRRYQTVLNDRWNARKALGETPAAQPTGKRYERSPYMTDRHGVWVYLNVGGIDDLPVRRRIAKTRIDHDALSYDTTPQQNWQHRYLVTGETGEQFVDISKMHLGKDASRAINELLRRGVHIVESKEARQHLAKFLRYRPSKRIIRTPQTGWNDIRGRWVFVLPDETAGDTGKLHVILDGASRSDDYGLARRGTSDQWREQIAVPLVGNSNVVLAVGLSLAGPLLRWAEEPPGGFHFHGISKGGKTILGAIYQSIWGKPYKPGAGANTFGYSWESTANRLGERAILRTDLGLYLDEIGIGDPRAIAIAIYKLAGGIEKGRFGRAERDFSILFLSTGELSLAEFLPHAKPGQLVRLVDIPAIVQDASVFETIPKGEIAAAGKQYYGATDKLYGAIGYDWLRCLAAIPPSTITERLSKYRDAWLALPQVIESMDQAHPQLVSVVNRFAFVAAALAFAIKEKILPWKTADTNAGIVACMQRWLDQRGNRDTSVELLREIERRRKTIAATIDDRFIRLTVKKGRLVPASDAERHKTEGAGAFDGHIKVKDGRILVKPEAWQRWWAGLNVEEVNKFLLKAELLIPDRAGKASRSEVVKSGEPPARFYVLAPAFIDSVLPV